MLYDSHMESFAPSFYLKLARAMMLPIPGRRWGGGVTAPADVQLLFFKLFSRGGEIPERACVARATASLEVDGSSFLMEKTS